MSLHDLDAAVDEIRTVGPSGDHLGRAFTRRHYRGLWQPTVIDQRMHDHWATEGEKTLLDRLPKSPLPRRAKTSPRCWGDA